MTPGRESQVQLETARPTTIISPRTTTTIGASNVRTMNETGKTAQVATEVRNYKLSIWLRSEAAYHRGAAAVFRARTRKCSSHSGCGSAVVQDCSEDTYWMGGAQPTHNHNNHPHKGRRISVDIIQCSTQTNNSKTRQGGVLQQTVRSERNVITVMVYFNAKIDSDNRSYEEVQGQQGPKGDE